MAVHQKVSNPFVQPISGNPIILPATNGMRIIANATDVFGSIGLEFGEVGSFESRAKPETLVEIQEVVADANYSSIFRGFGVALARLSFDQHQIIEYCRKYKHKMITYPSKTSFLWKVYSSFHVVIVYRGFHKKDELSVSLSTYDNVNVWSHKDRSRVVIPQLV